MEGFGGSEQVPLKSASIKPNIRKDLIITPFTLIERISFQG